ncbi:hypothetical protein BV372_21450 [Nostoc sp. T09]|uniref:hypothetical protein n=1 Tax=Nostoc sp. T09 TaxID=1932621 RepID=UPI000A3C0F95|nr:hypothetical protein [Nostoc sp. T09]OUL30686.1 hypothetical protein BV372_21450 [Nostoc sp. T09]
MNYFSDLLSELFWHLPLNSVLAQYVHDANLMGQMQHSWQHFVKTGQIWALLIGLIIGFIIRNLTSYG